MGAYRPDVGEGFLAKGADPLVARALHGIAGRVVGGGVQLRHVLSSDGGDGGVGLDAVIVAEELRVEVAARGCAGRDEARRVIEAAGPVGGRGDVVGAAEVSERQATPLLRPLLEVDREACLVVRSAAAPHLVACGQQTHNTCEDATETCADSISGSAHPWRRRGP